MPIFTVLWLLVCLASIALSLASARVLGPRSRWTIAGWLGTAAYFVVAAIDVLRRTSAPGHIDYAILIILTIAFVIAGRADEPQAEPWYWPTHAGPTGAERRALRAHRK